MKKLLFVLALGVFAACGNAENKEATTDSTATETVAPAATDSTATTDSSAAATTDSSAAAPAAH